MQTLNSFAALKSMGAELKAQAKEREAQKALEKARQAAHQREAATFATAMNDLGVKPIPKHERVQKTKRKTLAATRPHAPEEPEPASLALSDISDPAIFLESEDGKLFRRQGVSPDIPRKLYRGEWPIQAHIDLHGLCVDEARDSILTFLQDNSIRGFRSLRIVHGQGFGSETGRSILREMVRRWLKQYKNVMAFVQAPPKEGDAGATLVLLSSAKR